MRINSGGKNMMRLSTVYEMISITSYSEELQEYDVSDSSHLSQLPKPEMQ